MIGVALCGLVGVATAEAQYFGRNKVRFDTPAFRVLVTEHFDVYFYEAERRGAEQTAQLAERWYRRLSRFFDHELSGRQPLVLYASPAAFRQTNVIDGQIGEGTGGVTESLRRRIVMPLAGSLADTDHVLGHELVHAFQYDLADASEASSGLGGGAARLPLWFVEGMAEYLSLGPLDVQTAAWLRDAATHDALPSLAQLNDPAYFPYRWGHALWAYVGGRWGDDVVVTALADAGRGGSAAAALAAAVGVSEDELTRGWHAAIRQTVAPWLASARPPAAVGRMPMPARGAGELNVGPALSPDGRYVAYLSERDLLSVDLFVAEVASGRVVARVASTARDAHLSALAYIAAAGAWDGDGRRLAYATRRGADPAIDVYDVTARRDLAPIRPAGVDEVLTLAWSPDGTAIAFSGMRGGATDLFVVTVATGEVRALTADAFADLHPVFAPDGRSVVMATDRFTTRNADGVAGPYQLARVWIDDRRVERLATYDGDMLNPQWADAAGTALLFVGNADGAPNLWRLDLAAASAVPLTALTSGVTGITPLSPAASAAPRAGLVAFSALVERGYRLVVADLPALTATGRPATSTRADRLTPGPADGVVATYLASAAGLADAATFREQPYRSRFQLEAVLQPSIGVAVDRFGSSASGQVAFLWGDMLGDHSLVTAFQANTTVDSSFSYRDLGGLLSYTNRARRWNWNATVEQSPYRTGFVTGGLAQVGGETAVVEQEVIRRQTMQGASATAIYPFDDARRFEVGAGVQRYTFSEQVRTIAVSAQTGRELLDERVENETLPGLTLERTMAAYVFDRSAFGATGPVVGQRYRVEVAPTFGTIRYTGVLADYRRYVMPAPFYTLAGRVLHYGRYGAGGEDQRLSPLFLGYPELVRGYDFGSFRAEECEAAGCPVFDRLVGSRLLVANAELRMPLLRPFGLGSRMYGPLPIELALFADAGLAWTRDDAPAFAGGSRDWVTSAGATARANLFGFAIAQVSLARPFQRPGRGWLFQFSLTPGF
ncbi:MAG: BamA/TamA family outer membrane protein [Vicinamibacterales bacterium]